MRLSGLRVLLDSVKNQLNGFEHMMPCFESEHTHCYATQTPRLYKVQVTARDVAGPCTRFMALLY